MHNSERPRTSRPADEFTLMRAFSAGIVVASTLALAFNALVAPIVSPRVAGGMVLIATFALYTALGLEFLKLWAEITRWPTASQAFSSACSRLILLGACMAVMQYTGPDCTFAYPILRCTEQTSVPSFLGGGGTR
jgi:hypothetical protein